MSKVPTDVGHVYNIAQFRQHVQNMKDTQAIATPDQNQRGTNWFPEAHKDIIGLSKANYAAGGAGVAHDAGEQMRRAAGEVAALSPGRPSGMDWPANVPAAHQLRDMTDKQIGLIKGAVAANQDRMKIGGQLKAAKNKGEDTTVHEANYVKAQATFKRKSATARRPFAGTPLGHAGVNAIDKASDIHRGLRDPLDLGKGKERNFAHDLLHPLTADTVYHGESGVADQHMSNVMEGSHMKWSDAAAGKHGKTPMPDVGKVSGHNYAVDVMHEAAKQTGMRTNQIQPIDWTVEKEGKPGGRKANFGEGMKSAGKGNKRTKR